MLHENSHDIHYHLNILHEHNWYFGPNHDSYKYHHLYYSYDGDGDDDNCLVHYCHRRVMP